MDVILVSEQEIMRYIVQSWVSLREKYIALLIGRLI